jgi:hypothetical protein
MLTNPPGREIHTSNPSFATAAKDRYRDSDGVPPDFEKPAKAKPTAEAGPCLRRVGLTPSRFNASGRVPFLRQGKRNDSNDRQGESRRLGKSGQGLRYKRKRRRVHLMHAPPEIEKTRNAPTLRNSGEGWGTRKAGCRTGSYWALKVKSTPVFDSFAPTVTVWSMVLYFSCQASMV